jgi:hypothetical protein
LGSEAEPLSKRRSKSAKSNGRYYLAGGVVVLAVLAAVVLLSMSGHAATHTGTSTTSSSTSSTTSSSKPVILYVNQGNGAVNDSNFGDLLSTATSQGFNTVFFQVYRSGDLLFTTSDLAGFVTQAHAKGLQIYFALFFTAADETIPTAIYTDGEDGINLDMSTLPFSAQTILFDQLSADYSGKTAITTTNFTLSLRPDLLIFETYATADQLYIHPGIIAGVEVSSGETAQEYHQQFQYALSNSNGVMVFDYDHLVKYGL